MSQKIRKIAECAIQRTLLARLSAIPNVKVWRNNAGGARIGKSFVKFGLKGQADISGIVKRQSGIGQRLEIEVKKQGGKQSEAQKIFESEVKQSGGIYLLTEGVSGIDLAVNTVIGLTLTS